MKNLLFDNVSIHINFIENCSRYFSLQTCKKILKAVYNLNSVILFLIEICLLLSGIGFTDQLSTIFSALPAKRQTLLFTATNSETVAETIKACPNNPFVYEYDSSNDAKTVETLDQYFVLAPIDAKNCYLLQLVLDTR